MVNDKIFDLAAQLKTALKEQQADARKAISGLADGPTKDKLKGLLVKASSGKASVQEIQKELQKIFVDASKH